MHKRVWLGRCQYDGHEPFMLGQVVLSEDARFDEVLKALEMLWRVISPHPVPKIEPIEGMILVTYS